MLSKTKLEIRASLMHSIPQKIYYMDLTGFLFQLNNLLCQKEEKWNRVCFSFT